MSAFFLLNLCVRLSKNSFSYLKIFVFCLIIKNKSFSCHFDQKQLPHKHI